MRSSLTDVYSATIVLSILISSLLLTGGINCALYMDEIKRSIYSLSISPEVDADSIAEFERRSLRELTPAVNADEFHQPTVDSTETSSGNTVLILATKFGQKFSCKLPESALVADPDYGWSADDARNLTASSFMKLLAIPFKYTPCIRKAVGWWTYEFCFGDSVKQYHVENSVIVGDEISLGYFNNNGDLNATIAMMTAGGAKSTVKESLYFDQYYNDGSACELNKQTRQTHVRFYCDEELAKSDAYLHIVDEPTTCQYRFDVKLGSLCQLTPFLPVTRPTRPNSLTCQPLLDDNDMISYIAEKKRLDRLAAEEAEALQQAAIKRSLEEAATKMAEEQRRKESALKLEQFTQSLNVYISSIVLNNYEETDVARDSFTIVANILRTVIVDRIQQSPRYALEEDQKIEAQLANNELFLQYPTGDLFEFLYASNRSLSEGDDIYLMALNTALGTWLQLDATTKKHVAVDIRGASTATTGPIEASPASPSTANSNTEALFPYHWRKAGKNWFGFLWGKKAAYSETIDRYYHIAQQIGWTLAGVNWWVRSIRDWSRPYYVTDQYPGSYIVGRSEWVHIHDADDLEAFADCLEQIAKNIVSKLLEFLPQFELTDQDRLSITSTTEYAYHATVADIQQELIDYGRISRRVSIYKMTEAIAISAATKVSSLLFPDVHLGEEEEDEIDPKTIRRQADPIIEQLLDEFRSEFKDENELKSAKATLTETLNDLVDMFEKTDSASKIDEEHVPAGSGRLKIKKTDGKLINDKNKVKVRLTALDKKSLEEHMSRPTNVHLQKLETQIQQRLQEAGFQDPQGRHIQVKVITTGYYDGNKEEFQMLNEADSEQFSNMIVSILGGSDSEMSKEQKRQTAMKDVYQFRYGNHASDRDGPSSSSKTTADDSGDTDSATITRSQ